MGIKKIGRYGFDIPLFIAVMTIAVIGVVVISSATKVNIDSASTTFLSQIVWVITGIGLMMGAAFWDYRSMANFYVVIYAVNIVFLVLVLLFGSGDGVSRWLFGIQPSEFAKVFMIIYLAKFIDKNREKVNNISTLFLIFFVTAVPVILIKKQPSLSASLVILAIMFTMLFVAKLSFKYIGYVLLIAVPIAIILFIDIKSQTHPILSRVLDDYQLKRIIDNVNLDLSSTGTSNYQTRNSAWAIGSGKLFGKGLYKGTINQLSYLPESHNDFIFSVIGEELGFIGCLGVLALMLFIILRCIKIAAGASDNIGTLIASGVAGMLAFQSFVNVGVATGLLPNTGMPFPFLSYGGSSMWINMIAIGLVLNVGMRKQKSFFEG